MTQKTTKYHGRTARGRETVDDSLQAAVESVAHVANRAPAECVTYQRSADIWYVYGSQDELDTDMARGPITSNSPGWFAIVTAEEHSAAPERK